MTATGEPGRGCYGLSFVGVERAQELLAPVPDGAPELAVQVRSPAVDVDTEMVGPDRAVFRLPGGGSAAVDRIAGTATLFMAGAASVPHQSLVHPFLASSAAVMSRWHGRDAFHAGGFVHSGGAWVIMGDRGQGKSTLLALLAREGGTVLSDDLAVIQEGDVFAGPRCVDLRGDAAEALGCGEDIGFVGGRHRARMQLDRAPVAVPLRGWVSLQWGTTVSADRLPVHDRLPALLGNLALRMVPARAEKFLRYASLPFIRLSRPRTWSVADDAVGALLSAVERP